MAKSEELEKQKQVLESLQADAQRISTEFNAGTTSLKATSQAAKELLQLKEQTLEYTKEEVKLLEAYKAKLQQSHQSASAHRAVIQQINDQLKKLESSAKTAVANKEKEIKVAKETEKLDKARATIAQKIASEGKTKVANDMATLQLETQSLKKLQEKVTTLKENEEISEKIAENERKITAAKEQGAKGTFGPRISDTFNMENMKKKVTDWKESLAGGIPGFLLESFVVKMKSNVGAYVAGAKTMIEQGNSVYSSLNSKAIGFRHSFATAMENAAGSTGQLVGAVNSLIEGIYSVKWDQLGGGDALRNSVAVVTGLAKIYGYTSDEINKMNTNLRDVGLGPLDDIAKKMMGVQEIGNRIANLDIGLGARRAQRMFMDLAVELRSVRASAGDVAHLMQTVGEGFKTGGMLSKLGFTMEKDMGSLVASMGEAATSTKVGMEGYLYKTFGAGAGTEMDVLDSYFASRYGKGVGEKLSKGEDIFKMSPEESEKAFTGMDVAGQWEARFKGLEKFTEGMEGSKKLYAQLKIMQDQFGVRDEKTAMALLSQKDSLLAGKGMSEKISEMVKAQDPAIQAKNIQDTAMATASMDDHLAVMAEQVKLLVGNLMFTLLNLIQMGFANVAKFLAPKSEKEMWQRIADEAGQGMKENLTGAGLALKNIVDNLEKVGDKAGMTSATGAVRSVRGMLRSFGVSEEDQEKEIAKMQMREQIEASRLKTTKLEEASKMAGSAALSRGQEQYIPAAQQEQKKRETLLLDVGKASIDKLSWDEVHAANDALLKALEERDKKVQQKAVEEVRQDLIRKLEK